jgi:hypothetical protein
MTNTIIVAITDDVYDVVVVVFCVEMLVDLFDGLRLRAGVWIILDPSLDLAHLISRHVSV